jgi:hypothetical protein
MHRQAGTRQHGRGRVVAPRSSRSVVFPLLRYPPSAIRDDIPIWALRRAGKRGKAAGICDESLKRYAPPRLARLGCWSRPGPAGRGNQRDNGSIKEAILVCPTPIIPQPPPQSPAANHGAKAAFPTDERSIPPLFNRREAAEAHHRAFADSQFPRTSGLSDRSTAAFRAIGGRESSTVVSRVARENAATAVISGTR